MQQQFNAAASGGGTGVAARSSSPAVPPGSDEVQSSDSSPRGIGWSRSTAMPPRSPTWAIR